jgi:hypothetical protein
MHYSTKNDSRSVWGKTESSQNAADEETLKRAVPLKRAMPGIDIALRGGEATSSL